MATTAAPAPLNVGFGTPFQAQIDFLRQKLRLPTERWDDIASAAHDRAFVVAGAAKADLLADLHAAVIRGAEGGGYRAFQKDFQAIVAQHGWSGWTGEGTQEGVAWRTRVIYQTNMASSYAAGRHRQMSDPEVLKLHPYWRYIHSDSVLNPREQHQAWHGLTLLADHDFWKTHFPPNGFGCQCRITSVTKKEGEASARAGADDLPPGWNTPNPKTGAPPGIGKGFAYAPGGGVGMPLRQLVQDKLITYPPAIARALTVDINRYINATTRPAAFVQQVLSDGQRVDPLWLGFVENAAAVSAVVGQDVAGYMVLLPADAPRHVEEHHGTDGGTQRPATPDDYGQLALMLNEPDELIKGRTERGMDRLVVRKTIGGELFQAVFEVRPGKKNRALALVTLVVKTAKRR